MKHHIEYWRGQKACKMLQQCGKTVMDKCGQLGITRYLHRIRSAMKSSEGTCTWSITPYWNCHNPIGLPRTQELRSVSALLHDEWGILFRAGAVPKSRQFKRNIVMTHRRGTFLMAAIPRLTFSRPSHVAFSSNALAPIFRNKTHSDHAKYSRSCSSFFHLINSHIIDSTEQAMGDLIISASSY